MNIQVAETPELVAEQFAKELFRRINTHTGHSFHLALSGGSTPKLLFRHLSTKYRDTMPWSKIHFWWGDERCVPPNHADSNFGMTQQYLFSEIPVPDSNIHRIKGERNPEEEAKAYSEAISKTVETNDKWPVFDMIILGMGDDGHTASIFPHEPGLLYADTFCAVATHPTSGQKRISLTGNVLNHAREISFLVTGENKADRLYEIMNNRPEAIMYPAYHIRPVQGSLTWYIDRAAAARIL